MQVGTPVPVGSLVDPPIIPVRNPSVIPNPPIHPNTPTDSPGQDANDPAPYDDAIFLGAHGELDKVFTQCQLEYLLLYKWQYKEAGNQTRKDLVATCADHLIDAIKETGKVLRKTEEKNVSKNVKAWFIQRCRKQHVKSIWETRWSSRQETGLDVSAGWDINDEMDLELLEDDSDGSEGGEGVQRERDWDEYDAEHSDKPTNKAMDVNRQKVTPFHFLQCAITAEMSKLSSKEKEKYEHLADEWSKQGPTSEERAKLAEKDLGRLTRKSADTLLKQMGAQVVFLVTYQDTSDTIQTSMVDFNGLYGHRSFKDQCTTVIKDSRIMKNFGYWAKDVTPKVDAHLPPTIRKHGKPLLPLSCNRDGHPILPDLTQCLDDEQEWTWYNRLIRTAVTIEYAWAAGTNPDKMNPLWSKFVPKDRIREFIDAEYIPDDLVGVFKDPSAAGKMENHAVLQYWLTHQREGKHLLCFSHYPTKSGKR
ncbi:hypothetical protein H1R20_g15567, partial [Candolleomyces eurysporus]